MARSRSDASGIANTPARADADAGADAADETPKWGIGGAAPVESALNLRLVFAAVGFVVFAAGAAYSATLVPEGTAAYAWPVALSAAALFALINVVVLVRRRRQRAREERRRYGHELDHGVFE